MKSNHKKILLEIICMLFVILFVYAAMSKLMDYQNFKLLLGKSPLLTDSADLVVWFIPTIEIIIALLLVIPKYRLLGLYASFSLIIMFTAYLIIILNFAENIPCACGGILQRLGWREHIYFNLFFILIAGIGIIINPHQNIKQILLER